MRDTGSVSNEIFLSIILFNILICDPDFASIKIDTKSNNLSVFFTRNLQITFYFLSYITHLLIPRCQMLQSENDCYFLLVLPQIIIQTDHWKFQIFSRFIDVDWSLIYEDRFHH